ncbi:unnamed protein product [Cyprideis torosa]|uniref:eIF-4F 25 kDa subunit n=1 Tax=Cyprideis torosa TaxID=163714 RepID=A0A7R8WFW2_9CRUS|nr:unnamed protein product [Cyprideis torosa]CAG0897474.1 unnamed protein product [Cyprideis torosa]
MKDTTKTENGELGLPPELYIKHPLQHSWTMWFFKNDRTRAYVENQVPITTFHTVEDFWCLWSNIQLPSSLKLGWDYMLFKEGITPRWEDDGNVKGGRWLLTVSKEQRTSGDLDAWWLELLLCLIGEGFDDFSDEVTGAVVNIRPKQDKVAVWTRDREKDIALRTIGQTIKDRLQLMNTMNIQYQAHSDTIDKGAGAKPIYII